MPRNPAPDRSDLRLTVAIQTLPGCERSINEDNAAYTQTFATGAKAAKGALIVLADGVSGAPFGDIASALAVQAIAHHYYELPLAQPEALLGALRRANAEIHGHATARPALRRMTTTGVALAIWRNRAYAAWVGDSRAYLIRDGEITLLTEDHTVAWEMVRDGLITPGEARTHEGRNTLTRSLGRAKLVEIQGWPRPMDIRPADRFLLCTDGVHGVLTDRNLLTLSQSAPGPHATAVAIIEAAKASGGFDDMTIAVADVTATDITALR